MVREGPVDTDGAAVVLDGVVGIRWAKMVAEDNGSDDRETVEVSVLWDSPVKRTKIKVSDVLS